MEEEGSKSVLANRPRAVQQSSSWVQNRTDIFNAFHRYITAKNVSTRGLTQPILRGQTIEEVIVYHVVPDPPNQTSAFLGGSKYYLLSEEVESPRRRWNSRHSSTSTRYLLYSTSHLPTSK